LSKVGKEYNWVLRLDGDEELPATQLTNVYNTIENGQADVFIFPITNILQIKPFKSILSKTARLFRNVEGIKFTGIVHEEIDESVKKLNLKITNFNGHILHYGYLKNANTLDDKFKFYEKLALKEIEKDPNNFKPYYNLASHYCYLKDYTKAVEMYNKALALNDRSYMIWHDYAVACYFKLLQENQAKINAIEKLFLKSQSLMPNNEFGEYREKIALNLKRIQSMKIK
jgi:tetratricopeptide (TPR) repeat protein